MKIMIMIQYLLASHSSLVEVATPQTFEELRKILTFILRMTTINEKQLNGLNRMNTISTPRVYVYYYSTG